MSINSQSGGVRGGDGDYVLAHYSDSAQISSIKFYRGAEEAPLTWGINYEALPQGVVVQPRFFKAVNSERVTKTILNQWSQTNAS